MNTEERIKESAISVFFRFGYHATTINRIAAEAHVAKAAVHYYFRNKDLLYKLAVAHAFHEIVDEKNLNQEIIFFLITELKNNPKLFYSTMSLSAPVNWMEILNDSFSMDFNRCSICLQDVLNDESLEFFKLKY